MIICPNCKSELIKYSSVFKCKNSHSFDIAKPTYLNLLLSNEKRKLDSGDNKEMVLARKEFLDKNYYKPLLDELVKLIQDLNISTVLDAGCGEGYFINNIKSNIHSLEAYATDISKAAISQAAKAKLDISYIVANSKNLPLSDNSIDLILNIFSPQFDKEFTRLLRKDGYLIKISPGKLHLLELKNILYKDVYLNDEVIDNLPSFINHLETKLTYKITIDSNKDLINLFKMTPYFYKTSTDIVNDLYNFESLEITIDFVITIYKTK